MTFETLAIVTCSYALDEERCRRLCRSVDRFVPTIIEHHLIVPRRDYHLFSDLNSGRRRVSTVEDVVPGKFRQIPFLQKWWIDSKGWPVRGWIMQQITKLSANHAVNAEVILFADSDTAFIRPFDLALFWQQGKVRLHRIPGAKNQGRHLKWHHRAANLLGLKPTYFGSDYIGQMITWRRSVLEGLQAHLTSVHHVPWYQSVARSTHFSEYILYGGYVEKIVGPIKGRHFFCTEDPCHCCWFSEDAEALVNGSVSINPLAQAILLQSNLGMSQCDEEQVFKLVEQSGAVG